MSSISTKGTHDMDSEVPPPSIRPPIAVAIPPIVGPPDATGIPADVGSSTVPPTHVTMPNHSNPSQRDVESHPLSPMSPGSGVPRRMSLNPNHPKALPPLPYHLREHRWAVFSVSMIMFIDHGVLPPTVYFCLKYLTSLSLTTIFAIVTSVFGVVLGIECCWRTYKLLRKDGVYRPEGACRTRWRVHTALDYTQMTFPLLLIINVILVVIGTSLAEPVIELLALPMPLLVFNLSWQLLLFDFLRQRGVRTPFRMSSTPAGSRWPMYMMIAIEDIVAVDFNGKVEWRNAWNERYRCSSCMRDLVRRLTLYWGITGLMVTAVCLGLIFGLDGQVGKEVGYTFGWLGPWLWIIPSAIGTTWHVKRSLVKEVRFAEEQPEKFTATP